ncbi:MAG: DUF6531 domain-containing protein, partial [Myxococcaceae bacterium]
MRICIVLVAFMLASPSGATHFPWDQGHDLIAWFKPPPPGPCEEADCDPCWGTGSPVYLADGRLVWTEVDVHLPGRPGLSMARTFNSYDPWIGPFGKGWSSTCTNRAVNVVGEPAGLLVIVSNGKRYFFPNLAPPRERLRHPIYAEVRGMSVAWRQSDFILSMQDGTVWRFAMSGSFGRLISERSASGLEVTYAYDARDRLERIADGTGRFLRLSYDSRGFVEGITDHTGRVWQYGYDERGNLIRLINPAGGIRTYRYSSETPVGDSVNYDRLLSITDESGVVVLDVEYANGRVLSYTEGQNRFTYAHNLSRREVTKTDSVGSRWLYVYNALDKRVSSIIDPLNRAQSFTFAAQDFIAYQDSAGEHWPWVHAFDWPHLLETPAGERWRWEYAPRYPMTGPTSSISPSGRTTRATYDERGNVSTVVDPSGATSRFEWGQDGHFRSVVDALGRRTSLIPNAIGLPLQVTDSAGRSASLTYDEVGQLLSVTNPEGETLRFERNVLGWATAMVLPSGKRVTYEYDSAGRLLSLTDPSAKRTRYAYDAFGRPSARIASDGRRWEMTYRADNLVSTVLRPDGVTERYNYDLNKRLTSFVGGGESVSFAYDSRGLVTSVSASAGTVSLTYDRVGRLTRETFRGNTLAYAYDVDGQVSSVTTPFGTFTYARDVRGFITGISAPEGTYGIDYDAIGRRTRLSYPNGTAAQYGYDQSGLLTRIAYTGPFSDTLTYAYDDAGLLTHASSANGTWTYQRDADGQLLAATDGTTSFAYQYDSAGNRLGAGRQHDAANRLTEDSQNTYAYDALGRLLRKQDKQTGARAAYTWNGLGQLVSVEQFPNATSSVATERILFTYDP